MNIKKFLVYNNTVPIVFGVLFLSSGLVFAANEEAREFVADSVYQAEQAVLSIDNTYIANKNLAGYSPKVNISNVTEDTDFYYVAYTFTTIALVDHVWQDTAEQRTMEVDKNVLADYVDLGVYVTEQLKQLVDREIAYLKEVQDIEKKQVTNKVVATAYSGLVGQFIDESTEQLPGYSPLVVAPIVEETDPVAIARAEKSDAIPFDFEAAQRNSNNNNSGNSSETEEATNEGPVLTLLGANPARIPLNTSYSDLGVVTTSQEGVTLDLSISLSLNGEETNHINIDTSAVADWSVSYSATDQDGNTTTAERVVIVYDPNVVEEEEETATTTATTTETTTATSTEETATTTEETATTTTPEVEEETATTTEETTEVPEESTETATPAEEDEVATTTEETASTTATTTES